MNRKEKRLREKTNIDICKENGIQYSFLTNVVEEKNSTAKIRATIEIIAKVLCGTLGPYGSTTLIQDRQMNHIITKDGYDLCNRLTFQDDTARTVLDVIRNISSNQVAAVGDGSTSAIIVASALLLALTDEKNKKKFSKIASKDITNLLNDLRDLISEELKKTARPISEDMHELETIAKIATNNDSETGKFIFDLYRKIGQYGFVTTDVLKRTTVDTYEIKSGITWARGPIDECFFTGLDEKKIEYMDPKVFISNSAFTYDDLKDLFMPLIGDICGSKKQKLVIIAEDFNEDVRVFLKSNRLQHLQLGRKAAELEFVAVDIDTITKSGKNTIEDISILCGCEVYDKFKHTPDDFNKNPTRFIGGCEKMTLEEKQTQLISSELSGEKLERKEKIVSSIRAELEELSGKPQETFEDDQKLFLLKKRLAQLTSTTAVVNVGGKTLTERMSRERLIEDAIFACKSALKYGYITGGNIMIPRILEKNKEKFTEILSKKYPYIENRTTIYNFIDVIEKAFLESYTNVLNNSYLNKKEIKQIINECLFNNKFYNLKSHRLEDDSETQVINSLDTDLQILNSTISIIGILAVSNQVLTINLSVLDQVK